MTSAVRMRAADRIGPEQGPVALLGLIDLEDEAGCGEHIRGKCGVGVAA